MYCNHRWEVRHDKWASTHTQDITTHINLIYVRTRTSKTCSTLKAKSEAHSVSCQAPLAGLAMPLSVAWRGQRCQGFVYHATSTPSHCTYRSAGCAWRGGPVQGSHTHLHLSSIHPSIHPSIQTSTSAFPQRVSLNFPFSRHLPPCASMSALARVGWLAMPSVPSAATPSYSPPTLPTLRKGGLNHLCASVFPQWEKRGGLKGRSMWQYWGLQQQAHMKKKMAVLYKMTWRLHSDPTEAAQALDWSHLNLRWTFAVKEREIRCISINWLAWINYRSTGGGIGSAP